MRATATLLLCLASACASGQRRGEALSFEELLARHRLARLGEGSWTSLHLEGTLTLGDERVPLVVDFQRPGKVREEARFAKGTFVRVFDGAEGWEVNPFAASSAPRKLTEEELKDRRAVADAEGPLIDSAKKGIRLELLGDELIDGRPVAHVHVTRPDGKEEDDYLDRATYFVVRTRQKLADGSANEANYKEYAGELSSVVPRPPGLVMAWLIESGKPGLPPSQTIRFNQVVVEPALPAALFERPR